MAFRITTITDKGGSCGKGCADVIAAEGEIDNDTADRFIAFLSQHLQEQNVRPVVLIQSPGGTVVGAMQLGNVFRKIGAAVIVAHVRDEGDSGPAAITQGSCLSACVYAFIGGKKRVVPPGSRLGIHRMVINERLRDPSGGFDTQRVYGSSDIVSTLSAYTKMMGVDPGMIRYAEQISPDTIHIVTPSEISRWRLGQPHL